MGRIRGDLIGRTFHFARPILNLIEQLPNSLKGRELGRQFLRSGTAIGSNVRESDHALTDREFAQKCSIARSEASETHYWLELCRSDGLLQGELAERAIGEADELTRVLIAIVKATQSRLRSTQKRRA